MADINDVFGVGELEAAGSALIEAYERGYNLGDWRPSTSGCASPAVNCVVGADERCSCSGFLYDRMRANERGVKLPEKKFQDLLQAILRDDLAAEPSYYITRVQTFEEAGVPTEDVGLVVTMSNGSEYQVTIAENRGSEAGAWGR